MIVRLYYITIVAGLLMLPSHTAVAADKCYVPKAPTIKITPISEDIQYDFSLSTEQLNQKRSANGIAVDADSTTGGLRHDQPEMRMAVKWGYNQYPDDTFCGWYDEVEVTITLRPTIFIAKDFNKKGCREAILEHERQHVEVDRRVMNKYVHDIGNAIQKSVDRVGAIGPYHKSDLERIQKKMIRRVEDAVASEELMLNKAMEEQQAIVDTPEEYKRVSQICHEAGVDLSRRR